MVSQPVSSVAAFVFLRGIGSLHPTSNDEHMHSVIYRHLRRRSMQVYSCFCRIGRRKLGSTTDRSEI